MDSKSKIILISGPTASCKSNFAIKLAKKIDGEIVKVICAPYSFTNPRTGEVLQLQHGYSYRPKDSQDLVGHTKVQEVSLA